MKIDILLLNTAWVLFETSIYGMIHVSGCFRCFLF